MNGPTESPAAVAREDDLIIEAGRADVHYWRDLWLYRDLLGFLTSSATSRCATSRRTSGSAGP